VIVVVAVEGMRAQACEKVLAMMLLDDQKGLECRLSQSAQRPEQGLAGRTGRPEITVTRPEVEQAAESGEVP
jgi:hypothetical protein